MSKLIAICFFLALSHSGLACELPSAASYFLDSMREERDLTLRALAKSDLVFIGTVREIRHGRATSDPANRESEIDANVDQILIGTSSREIVALNANLHDVVASCFGNEAFWDDQVAQDGEYIFFVSHGRILSASSPASNWRRLGLAGQREVVLSAIRNGR